MNGVVRLAIVDPNDATRNKLKNLLLGIDMVWLEAECSRYEFFTDVVRQTRPDIGLISLDSNPEQGLNLIRQVTAQNPGTNILVVSSSQQGAVILQAMRNGAKEFLHLPLNLEDFLAALDRMHQSGGGPGGAVRSSHVITVAGVSGGVGCTSLAVNLACALSQDPNNSVVVIDLDLALGDADVWLDIIPDYTIQDVAENITRLDFALLKRSLTKHDCGAFLLPRPVQMDQKTAVTPDELRRVVQLLRATFTHLIIDISKSYTPLDQAALEVADSVLLVTQLDLPCLRNVVRMMQFFDYSDGLKDKVKVIVNRLGLGDAQISTAKALETIGREVFAQIPNDYPTMVESRNNGVPLIIQSPKAKLTRNILEIAAKLEDKPVIEVQETEEKPKPKKGMFSFFTGGGKK